MRQTENSCGRSEVIKATFAQYDNRPDECTLHPAHPGEGKQTTEWITATRGGYVSLGMLR